MATHNGSADRNRQLVHDLFERVINAHCVALADEFYLPDYVQHNPDVMQGLAGVKQLLTLLFTAFPDLKGQITLSLTEQDRVMAMVEWSGTHQGAFANIPPTHRPIQFRTAEIFRVANGLFAEHWDVLDNTRMLLTLGLLIPPPKRGVSDAS
jgi:predicted SnoaL-like aldol condensation-catalyzing enzyme